MSMLFVFIVLIFSIVGFFSQEWIGLFTRFFSIPGMRLFLPLFVVSTVVEHTEPWLFKGFYYIKMGLLMTAHRLQEALPFQLGAYTVARVLILVIIVLIPLWIVQGLRRRKGLSSAADWVGYFSALLWAMLTILMIDADAHFMI
jgi:hypothetical protein